MNTLTKLIAGIAITVSSLSTVYAGPQQYPYSVNVMPQHRTFSVVDLNQSRQINAYERRLRENAHAFELEERAADRRMIRRMRDREMMTPEGMNRFDRNVRRQMSVRYDYQR